MSRAELETHNKIQEDYVVFNRGKHSQVLDRMGPGYVQPEV